LGRRSQRSSASDGADDWAPHVPTLSPEALAPSRRPTSRHHCYETAFPIVRTEPSLILAMFTWVLVAVSVQAVELIVGYPLQALCVLFAALSIPRGSRMSLGAAAFSGAAFAIVVSVLSVVIRASTTLAIVGAIPASGAMNAMLGQEYVPLIVLSACASCVSALLERRARGREQGSPSPQERRHTSSHSKFIRTKQMAG